MKIESVEAEGLELNKLHLHLVIEGYQEALNLGQKLSDLKGREIDIKADVHREKRSRDANSYFYVLCGKIADNQGITKDEVHDRELCRYGQYLLDKNGNITWCLLPANAKTDDMDVVLKPTGKTENKNGLLYTWYAIMKPSHMYDTREMAILIDGVISDAKELGIEVLSPDEIKRMVAT